MTQAAGGRITVTAPDGVGEIRPGDDLASLVRRQCDLTDGDVVTVTSKVVSKLEGRHRSGPREESLAEETVRVVARRGPTTIVRNRLGLTMAAAGIDDSNVTPGVHLLLPVDPDATARSLREQLRRQAGVNVAVVVTDTAGRPWRDGQTDLAIGAAGLRVLDDHAGRVDAYGNPLAVTAPAVADELAGAAELASGKLAGRPFCVIRGRADLVLDPGDHGPGAVRLIREDGADLFGYGAREAVLRAVTGTGGAAFGTPLPPDELAGLLTETVTLLTGRPPAVTRVGEALELAGDGFDEGMVGRLEILCFACGWHRAPAPECPGLRFLPAGP